MLGFLSSVFWFFFSWFSYFAGWICLIGLVLYLLPIILTKILPVPNLKKKYQTEWALVTGGTSGIGAELTIQLAEQGLNVVIVGLPDKFMDSHKTLIEKRFPNLKFVFIPVNLGKEGYVEEIKEQTKNLDIGIVFLNAGFFNLGAIYKSPIEKHMAQTECNALSGAKIAYHFYDMWREQNANPQTNKPRAICFTSSSVHYLPGAYSCFYGATKGFVTSLALSLAVEAKHNNIHVCCVMPQYTRTNLYQNTQKLSMLDALDLIGSNPDHVAKTMIKSVGYGLHHRDQGIYSIGTGLVGKLVDQNLLVNLFSYGLKLAPEYKAMK